MLEQVSYFFSNIFGILTPFFSWVGNLFSSIPVFVYIGFLAGILLSVLALYLTKYFFEKQKRDLLELDKQQAKEDEKYKLPPIGGWLSEFFVRKGFFKVGRMSFDFLNSLSFLENSLKTGNYKYKKPWFLVLGPQNSGKTTLINNLDAIKSPWKSEAEKSVDNECNWSFLRNGVALDIKGSLFLENDKISADEIGWNALKNLLSRYRSAKPIDSIMLTISAEDLYGKNRITPLKCIERAKFISEKLMLLQDQLGIKIPIYVVVTKTDIIPGFKDFCKHIPISSKSNMFGWSNPYDVNAVYLSRWVGEALHYISDKINTINMDIACDDLTNKSNDSLFVFPYELEKIQDNLSIYVNQIFKSEEYKSSLILRGIYFVGDSGTIPVDSEETSQFIDESLLNKQDYSNDDQTKDTDNNQDDYINNNISKRLFFFGDLIYKKILEEYSLCTPQSGFLLTANKSLKIAKISTAAFVIVGGTGFYYAYSTFTKTKENLTPVINSMYRFMETTKQIPNEALTKKNDAFEGALKQFSNIMEELSKAKLSSVFIPASWFSPLKSKLNESLNLAYQNVIMRALYINLGLKARDFLHMSTKDIKPNTSIAQLALPTKSNEFIAMNKFVTGLTELSTFVDKFNELRVIPSPKVLSEIVEYAFNITLSQSFLKYYGSMKGKLSTEAFPKIDLSVYKSHARKTLSDLFQEFFNTIFIYSNPNSFPAQLDVLIRQLRNLDASGIPDIELMRRLSIDFNAVIKTFSTEEKSDVETEKVIETWMDKDVFEPDEAFEKFLCSLDNSGFFGEEISQAIVNNCAIGLFHLKQRLKELTKILTTDARFDAVPDQVEEVHPSQGIFLLAKSLKTLFDETYMRRPSKHRFIQNIPQGQILYWDDKLLNTAYELCKQFESFVTKTIGSFPVILQESFRLIARNSLQQNIISLVAQAQNFVPSPNMHDDAAVEELIRSRTANLRIAAPHLTKLLELLNYESVSFFYISLRDLLLETNYNLLHQINELMKKVGPYHIFDPSFSWWDGRSSPAYLAYRVKDSQDLNTYLNRQSQQVINVAINMAKPVVDFLTTNVMLTVDPLDSLKLTKWQRIVEQATSFEKKQPGNSIGELETFITTTFREYNIDNAFEKIKLADLNETLGDHFLETKQYIQKGILGRVEVLTRQKNIKNYQELSEFFNKYLRGRFPFTPPSTDTAQGVEVDPEDMRIFFKKFKDAGGCVEKNLDQIYQLGGVATEAIAFLRSVEKIYDLFQGYLETDIGGLPSIVISTDFNVNRDNSSGSNYIAEWSVKLNYDELIKHTDKSRQTRWLYGAPTEISFRWPDVKGLLEKPLSDPKQSSLTVLDNTAKFLYKGNWSILRMVRQHRANKGEYVPMSNPNSVVLKFIVPVGEGTSAILFNSMSFLAPSTNPNLPGKALEFPEFPTFAPSLSQEIERYRNEPVLGFGIINPATLN